MYNDPTWPLDWPYPPTPTVAPCYYRYGVGVGTGWHHPCTHDIHKGYDMTYIPPGHSITRECPLCKEKITFSNNNQYYM